jgi:hypothetical protein
VAKKCPRYERPTSNHNLNFPAQIFCGTVFYFCIVFGRSYHDYFFSAIFFTFHGLSPGLPDGMFSKAKIQIWVKFGGPYDEKSWYIP